MKNLPVEVKYQQISNIYIKSNLKLGMWACRKSRYYDNKTADYIYIVVIAYLPHRVLSLVIITDNDYTDTVQTLENYKHITLLIYLLEKLYLNHNVNLLSYIMIN
jgi:hypothetical protein